MRKDIYIADRIEIMKIVSKNTAWKGRGKKERTPCPRCKNIYMQAAYIFSVDRKWEKIGEYCAGCAHFIPALLHD